MEPTETVRVGRTSVEISRMGIGLAPLIGHDGPMDDAVADAILRHAQESGLRHVDVAPLYGLGRGEAALRRLAARSSGSTIAVSTKAGRLLRPRSVRNRLLVRLRELRYAEDPMTVLGDYGRIVADRVRRGRRASDPGDLRSREPSPTPAAPADDAKAAPSVVAIRDFTPDGVRRSARESLDRLGRDRVEIMFLHDPDGVRGSALDRAWEALRELRARGVAGAIGISSNGSASLARMLERLDADVVLLAGRYTLLDQSAQDDLLPLAARRGVAVVLGGIFNGGLLADPAANERFDYRPAAAEQHDRAVRIAEIGARSGVPIAAAAIQFAAAHPAVSSVVVGVRSVRELEDDLAWARLPIPDRFWKELRSAGLLRLDAPLPADGDDLVESAAG